MKTILKALQSLYSLMCDISDFTMKHLQSYNIQLVFLLKYSVAHLNEKLVLELGAYVLFLVNRYLQNLCDAD